MKPFGDPFHAIVPCLHCGKTLQQPMSQIFRGERSFCNAVCRKAHLGRCSERLIWTKICHNNSTLCWEWTGQFMNSGYPLWRGVGVHRYVWEKYNGPIPEGMLVCHRCDNKKCVYIKHLFLGTHRENMDDMVFKGRQRHLPDDKIAEIKSSKEGGYAIARRLGISVSTVYRYRKGLVKYAQPSH